MTDYRIQPISQTYQYLKKYDNPPQSNDSKRQDQNEDLPPAEDLIPRTIDIYAKYKNNLIAKRLTKIVEAENEKGLNDFIADWKLSHAVDKVYDKFVDYANKVQEYIEQTGKTSLTNSAMRLLDSFQDVFEHDLLFNLLDYIDDKNKAIKMTYDMLNDLTEECVKRALDDDSIELPKQVIKQIPALMT